MGGIEALWCLAFCCCSLRTYEMDVCIVCWGIGSIHIKCPSLAGNEFQLLGSWILSEEGSSAILLNFW